MAKAQDVILDENNKPIFKDGDFVIGASDGQHVRLMLFSEKGSWRESPLVGIGIRRFLNTKVSAKDVLTMKKEITVQLNDDGYKVKKIVMTSKDFKIDYERV